VGIRVETSGKIFASNANRIPVIQSVVRHYTVLSYTSSHTAEVSVALLNVSAEWLAFLIQFQQVLDSILSPETNYLVRCFVVFLGLSRKMP
jgi:hypothetical protein